jgi:hypothetical protein
VRRVIERLYRPRPNSSVRWVVGRAPTRRLRRTSDDRCTRPSRLASACASVVLPVAGRPIVTRSSGRIEPRVAYTLASSKYASASLMTSCVSAGSSGCSASRKM